MARRSDKRKYQTLAPRAELTLQGLSQKIDDNYDKLNRRLDEIVTKFETVPATAKEAALAEIKVFKDVVLPEMLEEDRKEVKQVVSDVVKLEAHGRRLNLIIPGKAESPPTLDERGKELPEDVDSILRHLFINELGIDPDIVRNFMFRDAHRLGKKSPMRLKPRPLICAFILQRDRNLVMSRAYKLKGSPISIKSDLPKVLSAKRDKLLMTKRNLQNRGVTARVAERGYMPVLETKRGDKWFPYKFTDSVDAAGSDSDSDAD